MINIDENIYVLAHEFIDGKQYYQKIIFCTEGYIGTWYLRNDVDARPLKPATYGAWYSGKYYASNYNQTRIYDCYDIQFSPYGSIFYNFYDGTHTNGWWKSSLNADTGFVNWGGTPLNYTLASIGVYGTVNNLSSVLNLLGYKISDKILFVDANTVEELLELDNLTINEVLAAKEENKNYIYKEISITEENFIPDTYYLKLTKLEYDMLNFKKYNIYGVYSDDLNDEEDEEDEIEE